MNRISQRFFAAAFAALALFAGRAIAQPAADWSATCEPLPAIPPHTRNTRNWRRWPRR